MGATRTFELDTAKDRDAQSVFERGLKKQEDVEEGNADSGKYHGLSAYKQYVKPKVGYISVFLIEL